MLAEDSMIRPLETENWCEVVAWCRDYHRWNKYPVGLVQRYAIGIYQIHQAMEWRQREIAKGRPELLNVAESYMAAFLHFQMTIEAMEMKWIWTLPEGGAREVFECDLTLYETKPMCWERMMYLTSKIMQQVFYKTRMMKTQRGSRFNEVMTSKLFGELQVHLISAVPSYLRKAGIYHASKIMSGTL